MVKAVEKAIVDSNLGLSPATEGQVLRLRIPELNEERRKELVKVAHKYAEAAKVAVRHVRRDGLDVLKKLEKNHEMSRGRSEASRRRGAEGDRRHDRRDRPAAGGEGKGNPHRLKDLTDVERRRAMQPKDRDRSDGAAHVAIIMDGNGRWAAARGLPRAEGPSPRRRGAAPRGARRARARHPLSDHLLLQLGELVAPGERDRRPLRSAAPLHPQRSRDAASRRRAGARHRRARRARARHLRAAERGRGADAQQHAPDAGRRLQLRLAAGNRATPRSGSRAKSPTASAIPHRSTPTRSGAISMRPTFPIPISSSAPAASSGCRIS